MKETVFPILVFTIQDLQDGVQSPYGFRAIFKADTFLTILQDRLKAMCLGEGVLGLFPSPGVETSPRYACVKRDTARKHRDLPLDFDPWVRCQVAGNQVPSFWGPGTAYIFLCDSFFTRPARPPLGCPTLVDGRFSEPSITDWRFTRACELLYNLNRFYLGENALMRVADHPKR